MKYFFQITKCQETGEPIIPLESHGPSLAWDLGTRQQLQPCFFLLSKCSHHIFQESAFLPIAAFSMHPWMWSHRTPANSLNAPGACHSCLPHLSLLSILRLLLFSWLTTTSSRKAPLPSGTHISQSTGRGGKAFHCCLGLLKRLT